MDKRPVGFFDSGLGGLTAVSAFQKLMPGESIVYFGDTARNPYGTRSVEQLKHMAEENLAFLERFQVKAIIAACGTMSANVPEVLAQSRVHVENVLTPSVSAMAAVPGDAPLAVIATEASIRSGAFTQAIASRCPGREIVSVACQDFVRLCESGHTDPSDGELKEAVQRLLAPIRASRCTALLLGCTHFGLIEEAIGQYLGEEVSLISASECAAGSMRRYLTENALTGGDGQAAFYTSGDVSDFEKKAGSFLGRKITARKGIAGE